MPAIPSTMAGSAAVPKIISPKPKRAKMTATRNRMIHANLSYALSAMAPHGPPR
jgi:hypothetical protein